MSDTTSDDACPFDRHAALESLGHRVHLLRDLAQLFLSERANMVHSVRMNLNRSNVAETERAIHSLRGAVGYFRAGRLWNITERMHAAAIREDLAAVASLFPQFEEIVEELADELSGFLADTE